ncbi:putative inorganic phosphate cotransporter [Bactrocera neohumeralis]|uniref:putative inorganic phosphate cotransporter n=1 Tax=Bactrocera neohumeralis TaxID=98809 RepID=UPI0021667B44|nr:putative inorganic phosphate cotransporter [Bactrocera neohumeralis]
MEKCAKYEREEKASFFGARHVQCFMIFIGLTVAFAQRVNFSVAIVAMTDRNATNPDFEEYAWSEQTKSYLLSGFFWGYFVTQIPGGQLAHKYGGKIMLLLSLGLSSILCMLTPLTARLGDWKLVFALRVVQGLIQGCIFPSTHTLLSKWVPPEERGSIGTFCYTGVQFGSVLMMGISGTIASSSLGWPGIFYISGLISLLYAVMWYFVGASEPSDYKWISAEEKLYIQSALVTSTKPEEEHVPTKTPWVKILTSVPFLVILIAQSTFAWGFWTMLIQIPSYMKNILKQDIKSNAVMSALPYLVNMFLTFGFCGLNNFLIKRNLISIRTSRKLFNTIGFWVPVLPLILLGYLREDQSSLAVGLLVILIGVNSAAYLGFLTNHIDLSPNFAGILMGVANCMANLMGVVAPLLVGFIVTDSKNVNQWRIIFNITAALYFIGNLLFILFGQVKIQKWNYPKEAEQQRDHIKFEPVNVEKEVY